MGEPARQRGGRSAVSIRQQDGNPTTDREFDALRRPDAAAAEAFTWSADYGGAEQASRRCEHAVRPGSNLGSDLEPRTIHALAPWPDREKTIDSRPDPILTRCPG